MRAQARTLSHAEARRVYDRIGAGQDLQAFYEDRATNLVMRDGEFGTAASVFEFGCGTGRFAQALLERHLPPTATYRGADVSPTMIGLATAKLAPFGARASAALTEGGAPTAEPTAAYDRFVSNFVFDLLSETHIAAVLREARRMLRPGGLLCLASLSPGHGPVSSAVIAVWSSLYRLDPKLVGGCRAIALTPFLADADWRIRRREALAPFGLPSEVLVAERLATV